MKISVFGTQQERPAALQMLVIEPRYHCALRLAVHLLSRTKIPKSSCPMGIPVTFQDAGFATGIKREPSLMYQQTLGFLRQHQPTDRVVKLTAGTLRFCRLALSLRSPTFTRVCQCVQTERNTCRITSKPASSFPTGILRKVYVGKGNWSISIILT
jgi:hypothetical protein